MLAEEEGSGHVPRPRRAGALRHGAPFESPARAKQLARYSAPPNDDVQWLIGHADCDARERYSRGTAQRRNRKCRREIVEDCRSLPIF
jgi:hypothetical protein